ncbi:MAG: oxygen-independent coproporphyrinogen III oxidase [Planctomycetes bacterium]|nr:oxygen-independent coproporphyrinogen III oxidase [Planctomycetota bacterium]
MKRADFELDESLLLDLSGPGPRYTSYPTVPEWSEAFGSADAFAALERASSKPNEPLSLYVHLPFCGRMCLFCGCTVEITKRRDRVERYLDALDQEFELVARRLGQRRGLAQLHWGGGTPTHLDVGQIERVFDMITRRFKLLDGAEVSLEAHPHVTTHEQIDVLRRLGFNRISMGVQDLDPHVQKVIHRDQTTEETVDLVAYSRKVGFEGVNLDLLYGLPEQNDRTFGSTLDTIAEIKPDRLAVYGYAHVPWHKEAQRSLEQYRMPTPPERARLFGLALEKLGLAGYEVIGLDHFALRTDALYLAIERGLLHRNFMGYTTAPASEMIALGMSSISDVGDAFFQNARTTAEYEERIAKGELPVVRGMVRSAEDDLRRAVIQDVMCRMKLDLDELEARFGRKDLATHFASEWKELERYQQLGFCTLGPRRLDVTPKGRLFLRHLAMVFDAYLKNKPKSGEERFSRTV